MASEKSEFDGLLAAVDAKIAALVRLRESLIAAASLGALGQVGDIDPGTVPPGGAAASTGQPAAPGGPIDLPTGVFRGKGLADAIRLYMSLAKRKQTFKEIKAALVEGGLATTSEFFEQTLNSTLHRMRKSGEVLQFKDGWDLAESYPPGFRQRLEESREDTPKRKRKTTKSKTARADKATEKTTKPKKPADKPQTVQAESILRAV
jgi:hypothetical protein